MRDNFARHDYSAEEWEIDPSERAQQHLALDVFRQSRRYELSEIINEMKGDFKLMPHMKTVRDLLSAADVLLRRPPTEHADIDAFIAQVTLALRPLGYSISKSGDMQG